MSSTGLKLRFVVGAPEPVAVTYTLRPWTGVAVLVRWRRTEVAA